MEDSYGVTMMKKLLKHIENLPEPTMKECIAKQKNFEKVVKLHKRPLLKGKRRVFLFLYLKDMKYHTTLVGENKKDARDWAKQIMSYGHKDGVKHFKIRKPYGRYYK